MRSINKKTYCLNCHRLVSGIEQKNNDKVSVICSICSKPIWIWNGIKWSSAKKVS
jgi:RNase P subunit RPR2